MKLQNRIRVRLTILIQTLSAIFLYLFDGVAIHLFSPKKKISKKKKVLIVRVDAAGDFFMWLDAAKSMRQVFPRGQFEIFLLANNLWSSIAEELPFFDTVWSLDRREANRNLFHRLRLLKKIGAEGFCHAIYPAYSREFLLGDSMIRASRAPKRIAFKGDLSNIWWWQKYLSDQWFTELIPSSSLYLKEWERNTDFIRKTGLKDFTPSPPSLPVPLPPFRDIPSGNYYVVCPGAGINGRCWPIRRFAEICRRIFFLTGWSGVICGGTGERELGYTLMANGPLNIRDFTGKTTLKDFISIVSGAVLVLGNDSASVHIASATSTPAVYILGGGHFKRFTPFGNRPGKAETLQRPVFNKMECFYCNWNCIYDVESRNPFPCVGGISVDQVWNVIIKTTKGI